jgi:hypothetical protein
MDILLKKMFFYMDHNMIFGKITIIEQEYFLNYLQEELKCFVIIAVYFELPILKKLLLEQLF